MKFRSFVDLMNNNADMSWLPDFMGPPVLRERLCRPTEWTTSWFGSDPYHARYQRYVNRVVDHIDFRPWGKLNLEALVSEVQHGTQDGHGNPCRSEVRYGVAYRLEGMKGYLTIDPAIAENRGDWSRDVRRDLENVKTVSDLLSDVCLWSGRGRWQDGHKSGYEPVLLVAVVKITRWWNGAFERYTNETIDIYRVPESLAVQKLWTEAWLEKREAKAA